MSPPSGSRCERLRIYLYALAGTIILALVGCGIVGGQSPEASDRRITGRTPLGTPILAATLRQTAMLQRGNLEDTLSISGYASPLRATRVIFPSGGTVTVVTVQSGQMVRRGDPLMTLAVDTINGQPPPAVAPPSVVTRLAPIDGRVVAVEATTGQFVEAQSTAVRVADASRYLVLATVSEYQLAGLAVGQPANVVFPSLSVEAFPGTIQDLSEYGLNQTETVVFPVRIQLSTVPPQLRVGMTAQVNVVLRRAEDVVFVPTDAIRRVGGGPIVTKVAPTGQLTEALVDLGNTYGANIEILSGVEPGEGVAVYSPVVIPTPSR